MVIIHFLKRKMFTCSCGGPPFIGIPLRSMKWSKMCLLLRFSTLPASSYQALRKGFMLLFLKYISNCICYCLYDSGQRFSLSHQLWFTAGLCRNYLLFIYQNATLLTGHERRKLLTPNQTPMKSPLESWLLYNGKFKNRWFL